MGLIERIHKNYGMQKEKSAPLYSGDQFTDMAGFFSTYKEWGDTETLNQVYSNLVYVHSCVFRKSRDLSQLPFLIHEKKGDDLTDVTESDDFDILRIPNPYFTFNQHLFETYARLELQGECFWVKFRDNTGRVRVMYADWRSHEVEVKVGENYIETYIHRRNGRETIFSGEDVLFIRYFNPESNVRGLSKLKAGAKSVTLELKAMAFKTKHLDQGGRGGGYLFSEGKVTDPERIRMQQEYQQNYKSIDKLNNIPFLTGGVKFMSQALDIDKAEFEALKNFNREEISALYEVPPELLSFGKATHENKKFAQKEYWSALRSFGEQVCDPVARFFLPEISKKKNLVCGHDYEDVAALQEDKTEKVKRYVNGYQSSAISPNEIRVDCFGLEPFDDDDYDIPGFSLNSGMNINQLLSGDGIGGEGEKDFYKKKAYY